MRSDNSPFIIRASRKNFNGYTRAKSFKLHALTLADGFLEGSTDGKIDGCDRECNVSSGNYDDFNVKLDGISFTTAIKKA